MASAPVSRLDIVEAILSTTPAAFGTLLQALKRNDD
jgi:hypothetical protein